MSDQDVADALECDLQLVGQILDAWAGSAAATASGRIARRHGPQACVKLAIAHALRLHAGLALPDAAAVAAGSTQVPSSVLRIMELEPKPDAAARENGEAGRSYAAPDPFALFAPHAAEAIPIPAIDEYLDVADGRRVYWRRPKRDPYALACELHRLSDLSRREDTPAFQDEYLEKLFRLREPADQVCEWIGTVAGGRFRPAPERFAECTPAMRQGVGAGEAGRTFAETYATKVSVNVSLAARSMKRRALGLAVTNPLLMKAPMPVEGTARR